MLLAEVFDTTGKDVQYQRTEDSFRASAQIGDRTIVFLANLTSPGQWSVQFTEQRLQKRSVGNLFGLMKRRQQNTFDVTGSGNEMQVFGFVVNCIKQFVAQYKPDAISFTAKAADAGRSDLYNRMARRIKLPGYKYLGRSPGSKSDSFTIVKDDLFD